MAITHLSLCFPCAGLGVGRVLSRREDGVLRVESASLLQEERENASMKDEYELPVYV